MSLFQKSVENKYLNELNSVLIDQKYKAFQNYFGNPLIQENIRNSKEEQFQEGFLRELFVSIFGYTLNPHPDFNLTTELKNIVNSKKADGAILSRVHSPLTNQNSPQETFPLAVIELKGTDTTDLDKIETQAFGYKNHHPKCIYVITSNFEKLRFYIQNAVDHIDFDLFNLDREQFSLMWLCLAKDNLLNGIPLKIKESSLLQEENITKKLYADYSKFREAIYNNLVKNNPETDKLLLFKKTQKLLDRFLFILFAEDRLLLPPNSISEIVKQWTTLKEELDEYVPLYDRFKKYFGYMNTGYKGKKYDIYAYNGGLFSPDEILDNISIDDEIIHKHTMILSQYDYETDVDVNILGHIFEHSLGEIENVQAEIKGEKIDSQKTKRKKDGIFYTPKYITKYIVENTVGKLCAEKRAELDIIDEEYVKGRKNRKKEIISALDEKLTKYRDWLLNLTILDPACGSGAFLNQALDYLITEHRKIDDLRTQLLGGGLVLSDITTDILEKNIYGVDLNEESVEIAKLSLWLRTAQKGRKLNKLNNNIKCGNSLIDDREVAGEKAFNWYKEFPNIFREKKKKVWHVTTATHNSRYSQRMFDNHVIRGEAEWFDTEDAIIITETVKEIAISDKLNILEYNICGDHMHILLVCEEEELPNIVGKIKSVTAKIRNRKRGYTGTPGTRGHAPLSDEDTCDTAGTTRGHAPLSEAGEAPLSVGETPLSEDSTSFSVAYPRTEKERGNTQRQVWTQKFGKTEVMDHEYLANAIKYIRDNRIKHELPEIIEIINLKKGFLCTPNYAFRQEYKGGFDVVIGNPPYVRAELLGFCRDYLASNYVVFNPSGDLFSYFYEQSFKLLNATGLFGFISNTFDKTTAGVSIREYLQREVQFLKYIDFTEVQIFEGATTYPVIITARNQKLTSKSFEYIKIPKSSQSPVIDIEFHDVVPVNQSLLDKENWSFKSNNAVDLIERLKQNKTIRDVYGKCNRGIVTGFNEAFIVNSDFKRNIENRSKKDAEIIKPILEGKDIEKWNIPDIDKCIIFSRRGIFIDQYPVIKEHFEKFRNQLNPRTSTEQTSGRKPGSYKWYEIQDSVDYYKNFEKPKIVFPNLQNSNKFAYDESGAYINAPAVILPTNDRFLTAVLNSKLVWYFLTNLCVVRNGGYIEVKPQYFEQIPIPALSEEFKVKLSILTNDTISKTVEKQKVQIKFSKLLFNKYPALKETKKLENWFGLDFIGFKKELSKQRVTFSLSEESEWIEYFDEQTRSYKFITSSIANLEREIDQLVYEIYGLTDDEIKIVEGSV